MKDKAMSLSADGRMVCTLIKGGVDGRGSLYVIVLLLGITVSLGSSLSTSRLHLRPLFFLDRVFP